MFWGFYFLAALSWVIVACGQELTVTTRTGIFVGGLNDTYPDVRQFLWIPYAKPPIGKRRWTPPEKLGTSSKVHESTVIGPVCPQYVTSVPSAWACNITGNLVVNYGESLLAGMVAQNSAEDCLALAVWTPASATSGENLPVILFSTGGGQVTGGIDIPTQLPAEWVHNSQKHIVVTINYRVNIFGYPNARGLNGSTNFANQDQRMAIEWVHENIAAFGGDPSRITLWGQSAGAGLTSSYLFAYKNNPIIKSAVTSSGTVFGAHNADYSGSNFTFVAQSLGCDFEDAALELDCMRKVAMPRIENFIGQYQDNSTYGTVQPAITFTSQVDNTYIFSNYTELYLEGKLAKIPQMIGTTAREGAPLVAYPIPYTVEGPSLASIVARTVSTVCYSYNASVLRDDLGLTTYRYQWAGNFSDLTGNVPWLGAYHYSDLYMFFGSYLITPGASTALEVQTSQTMQNLLYAFLDDPLSLPSQGWPEYHATNSTTGGTLARFGGDGLALQLVDGNDVDGVCHIPGDVYNTTP